MAEKPEIPTKVAEEDLPLTPMSLGSTTVNRTGSWKYLEPYFEDQTPPCVERCPVQNDISILMRFVEDGDYDGGARYLLRDNPFPAILGRVCSHPCEQPCNRKALGGAVRIQGVERFLGDYALEHAVIPELPEVTKSTVAVVGAGPAGLSASYFLRVMGHEVTVHDRSHRIGGLLWREIPRFKLPAEVLDKELGRFEKMGIRFQLQSALGRDFTVSDLRRKYKAVVLAIGKSRARELGVPGEEHPSVIDGADLIGKLNLAAEVSIGRRVLVIGGGNTAMDAARLLLRLGHDVRIIYRRSRREMLASKLAIDETLEEGIPIEFQVQPSRFLIEGDRLVGVECVRTELGELDASKRAEAHPIEGTEFVIPTDTAVVAMGKVLELDDLGDAVDLNGGVQIDFQYHTSVPGVYAAGDCVGSIVTGGDAVGDAVRMGREVAAEIHFNLEGGDYVSPDPLKRRGASGEIAKIKSFNRAYLRKLPPVPLTVGDPTERVGALGEYMQALKEGDVRLEAARCIKCGTCITCDNCHLFCPDAAIVRRQNGDGYEILCEYCKGCGVCVEECPRGAIHLRRVEYGEPDAEAAGDQP